MSEIEESFKKFIKRDDIDIILISQNVIYTSYALHSNISLQSNFCKFQIAEMIRHVIDSHASPVPAVLEIPSKDHPYDPTKDSILRRARGMFNPEEFR